MRRDNWFEATIKWIAKAIVLILWLIIWVPISSIYKYLVRLSSEVAAGIHKNLVKWLSVAGLVFLLSLLVYFFNLFK